MDEADAAGERLTSDRTVPAVAIEPCPHRGARLGILGLRYLSIWTDARASLARLRLVVVTIADFGPSLG